MWILATPNPRTLVKPPRARRSRVYGETQVAASLAPDKPGVGYVTLPIDLAPWALELRCARVWRCRKHLQDVALEKASDVSRHNAAENSKRIAAHSAQQRSTLPL